MGKYIVSARKYRPRRFQEVVGQDHVVNALRNAVKTDQLAHAFLFCGPRGVGKTTCARILARTINCENIQNGVDPCGDCASCAAFDQNASFNIIELDAASHNSVDHIRALNEQVRFRPQQGEYKVYIIDEVHMLSTQAFNAFLKTLEEPPPYAIFILATTEKHKIIPTILSRCQIFDFKRIQVKDIVSHLAHICEQEEIEAEQDALIAIAQKCDGALRDALSLFDRLVSVSDKNLTYQSVVHNLNLLDYDVFFKTADACLREDVRDVLMIFDQVLKNGFEGDVFLSGLASHYRDLLVSRDEKTLQLQDHSEAIKKRYHDQAQLMSTGYIFSALNIINETDITYPQVRNKRLHVEMALAKVCFLRRLTTGAPLAEEKKTDDGAPIDDPVSSDDKSTPRKASKDKTGDERKVEKAGKNTIKRIPSLHDADNDPDLSTPDNGGGANSGASLDSHSDDPEPAGAPGKGDGSPEREKVQSSHQEPGQEQASAVLINTPQLGSLTLLETEVKEIDRQAQENSLALTLENVLEWWEGYVQNTTSPSVLNTLKQARVSLDGKCVGIEVNSSLAKVRIQEEQNLLSQLRETFHDQQLVIDIVVNVPEGHLEENKPKKLLTNKEKYELLCAKNPKMRDLKQRLDLVVDHDD